MIIVLLSSILAAASAEKTYSGTRPSAVESESRTRFPTAEEVLADVVKHSPWWLDKAAIPGWWGEIRDFRNVKTKLGDIQTGPLHDSPIKSDFENYSVKNCTPLDRPRKIVIDELLDHSVSAQMVKSITTEDSLSLNLGTNPSIASFLQANISIGSKITVNMTSTHTYVEHDQQIKHEEEERVVSKMSKLIARVDKRLYTRNLRFTAPAVLDAEVLLESYNPNGASGTAHQKRWLKLSIFEKDESKKTTVLEGLVTSGRMSMTTIEYYQVPLTEEDCVVPEEELLRPPRAK